VSISAICPVANLVAVNAALEEAGHGPNNFSIPAYSGPGATHAALHSWDSPAFLTSLQAIPEVTILAGPVDTGEVDEDLNPILVDLDPTERTRKVVEDAGAQWAGDAPELPDSGMVEADTIYRYGENEIWYVIQAFDRSVYGDHPSTYQALIRRVRNPNEQGEWRQPLDQFDAYYVVNPFTGQPDQVTHNGLDYYVTSGDAEGLNVWEPGTQNSGWTQGVYVPPVEGEEPVGEQWIDTGATVTGQTGQLYYVSEPIANLGLTVGQAIKLGDAETTYAGTWGGTDDLMQIDPYVAASVGDVVWKWA